MDCYREQLLGECLCVTQGEALENIEGRHTRMGGFVCNTAQSEIIDVLESMAFTDALTGVGNQRHLQLQHQQLVSEGRPHALLAIDLDNFKEVNTELLHAGGDEFLKSAAEAMHSREEDIVSWVSRKGGDEFVILLDLTPHKNSSLNDHERVHAKIMRVKQRFNTNPSVINYNANAEKPTGMTIGYAIYNGQSLDELHDLADQDLMRQKAERGQ